MNISRQKTVKDIQEEFSSMFEGLKIEFYESKHVKNTGSTENDQIDPSTPINEINPNLSSSEIILNGDNTVAQFEEEMKNKFGLNVQVFRRSNTLYLQTISTDNWTLNTQNTKGIHSVQD